MAGLGELFDGKKRRAARARRLELEGKLEQAAELYLEAGRGDEAARLLLLRADAEPALGQRIVLCGQAARMGRGTEVGREAERRKAVLRYELCRSPAGAAMQGELPAVAAELELGGEWQKAAEAFALLGDRTAELRVLEQAGAIEQLEGRLSEDAERDRQERERGQLLRQLGDLDRVAERRKALRLGQAWLARQPDEAVALELERIRGRLVAGPVVTLEVGGECRRYALGNEVTIGRADATIVVCSSAVSRQHLRLFRRDGVPWVEDLETRNGTSLGGARMAGALPVGSGLRLLMAGQVECAIAPLEPAEAAGAVAVEVAAERTLAPLGPCRLFEWEVDLRAEPGDPPVVVLRTPVRVEAPCLGSLRLGSEVDLGAGDELRAERDGPVVLKVLPSSAD